MRGAVCSALLATIVFVCAPAQAHQPAAGRNASSVPPAELTLLGTAGGPGAMVGRAGIASLLTIDGHRYLIDAGDGVTGQLAKAGLHETDIHTVFLTHLHDDHTSGLPALASFGYTLKSAPLEILGPPQTTKLVAGLLAFLAPNADIRMTERHLPAPSTLIRGQDLPVGAAYSDGHIKVATLENTHFHFPANSLAFGEKSYSYRIEAGARVFVFTGDTGPTPKLVEFAKGADVLVAEMVTRKDMASVPPAVLPHMLQEHLTASDIGNLANAAGVKTVVLSHVRDIAEADADEIRRITTAKVVIGHDLDTF